MGEIVGIFLELAKKLGVGIALSIVAGLIVGYAGPGGLLLGFADDILTIFLSADLSWGETFALNVAFDESEKMVHEAIIYDEEDRRQRAARHAALVRWHGNKLYVYGGVSVADFARLAVSGYVVGRSPLAVSVSEWVADGWEAAAEGLEFLVL